MPARFLIGWATFRIVCIWEKHLMVNPGLGIDDHNSCNSLQEGKELPCRILLCCSPVALGRGRSITYQRNTGFSFDRLLHFFSTPGNTHTAWAVRWRRILACRNTVSSRVARCTSDALYPWDFDGSFARCRGCDLSGLDCSFWNSGNMAWSNGGLGSGAFYCDGLRCKTAANFGLRPSANRRGSKQHLRLSNRSLTQSSWCDAFVFNFTMADRQRRRHKLRLDVCLRTYGYCHIAARDITSQRLESGCRGRG